MPFVSSFTVPLSSRPLLRLQEIRAIEAVEVPLADPPLMERAGAAIARAVIAHVPPGGLVCVLCGPGNNGGDGFVAARRLLALGRRAVVIGRFDGGGSGGEAAAAREAFVASGGVMLAGPDALETPPAAIVDALFGIGLARPIGEPHASWIEWGLAQTAFKLAVDVPSGLDADTGRCTGPCFTADLTSTFLADKPGLHTLDGPDRAGKVVVDSLGIDPRRHDLGLGRLLGLDAFADHLQPRRKNTHKGSFGHVLVVGGAPRMSGAAFLAGHAALATGAGKVTLCALDPNILSFSPVHPELMVGNAIPERGVDVLVVGPGLGASDPARALLARLLPSPLPLVLDADGLNRLAVDAELQESLRSRPIPAILTPHPMEAARLLGTEVAAVQNDRIAAAQELARRYRAHVVLKGCGSIVADPDGTWAINPTGNPGMASAGMGDVLSGLLGSLLAQGWPVPLAARFGTFLHGAAADRLVAEGIGPIGLRASETVAAARQLVNEWSERNRKAL
ncbi:NAD(P)H-hydrate dehydratase [Tepidiphilus baoligensis]|uniref:Bifunctional NAD(P)H-hydrate repair enzyme n=1 Tax=Tepidiphilus baoligensis TaxID=2698687 RepID=A0ABX1QIK4_9PROT|nr:NAD(P)H-hydrate dehydratase [Tepidiphilus baoligensis]NMH15873.1 NAD(P)H-hydrate dehydratase [Tepidiphilus baoligensis]